MKFELDLRFVCPLSSHCPDEHLRLHVGLIDYSIRCIFLRVQRMYSPFHCVGMRCPQLCDRGITHWHLDHPQQLVYRVLKQLINLCNLSSKFLEWPKCIVERKLVTGFDFPFFRVLDVSTASAMLTLVPRIKSSTASY